jgi:hypothetical protein
MSDKVLSFLRVVGAQFNKRHASPGDEKIWLASMVQGLRDYDASVLARAGQKIIMSKTDPGFPFLAECRKACEEVIRLERAERTPKFDEAAKEKTRLDNADWQFRLADELIQCQMGRVAASEGWALSLHDYIRINGKLPSGHDVERCKASARGFDKAYEEVLNGAGGMLAKPLEGLGDAMLTRRGKIEAAILGGAR